MAALHDIYIVEKTRFIDGGLILQICPEEDPELTCTLCSIQGTSVP